MTDTVRRIDPTLDADDTFERKSEVAPGTTMSNPLDELAAAITEEVRNPDLTLAVPLRPGMSLRYDTNIDADTELMQWRRRSHDKSQPDNFNILKMSCIVIANCCKAVVFKDVEPTGSDGQPITFNSTEMFEWTKTKRAIDAVKALFGNDAHVLATAQDIIEAAGYGDEMMEPEEGPTKRS